MKKQTNDFWSLSTADGNFERECPNRKSGDQKVTNSARHDDNCEPGVNFFRAKEGPHHDRTFSEGRDEEMPG
jgi:hypothetical protein